jgi:hypothetical protein
MTEKIGYKLNPVKLAGASQSILPYVCGAFYYTEDYEYFDVIKNYLDIPEPPKTLEEISQELDEKFDDLLVRTKRKFAVSKETAEYHYNRKFETINGNFEYAKSYGYFPQITFLDGSKFTISNNFDISFPSFVIKQSNSHQGYYTIGEDRYYRFYMEKKPNRVFRWFIKRLMGFKWIDEVLK